jgi:flagellar biosynthetic protein FlhB
MRTGLEWEGTLRVGDVAAVAMAAALQAARPVLPVLIVLLVLSLLVMYVQVGPLLTWTPITPSLSKLNPLSGLGRIFSPRSAVQLLLNVGKLVLVGGVAYLTFMGWIDKVLYAMTLDFVSLVPLTADLCFRLGVRVALVMLLLGLLDYFYQRYRHE